MTPIARALRWMVGRAAPPEDRASVLADLDEEFAARRRDSTPFQAFGWYLSQSARSIWALLAYRVTRRRAQGNAVSLGRHLTWFVWTDLRHGGRALRRTPTFTIIAGATIAVGIGASTAAFTAFNAALLAPLPYPNQARLVSIAESLKGQELSDSYPDFLDWRDRAQSFDALTSFRGLTVTLTGDGPPERVRGQIVNANLFDVLGVAPLLGRTFDQSLDGRNAPKAVVLGFGLWRGRFNGDPAIVGRTISVDGSPRDVLGVMPANFDFPSGIVYSPADLYLSFGSYRDADLDQRNSHPGLAAIGLLRPGVTIDRARDELSGIAATLRQEHPDTNHDETTIVRDPITMIVGDLRSQVQIVIAAALLLLLIACANVAALTLTRTISRRRELAVRAALGAGQARLATSLLAEHLVLAALGAVAGVGLAYLLTAAVRPLVTDLPRLAALRPNAAALLFAVVAMAATAALCSVAPMLWLRRAPMDPWLRQRGQTGRGLGMRQWLVATQIALALTLIASAALLTSTLTQLQSRSGGIVADGVLTFGLRLPEASYADRTFLPFYTELVRRLSAAPGVVAAGAISTLPFSGSFAQTGFHRPEQVNAQSVRSHIAVVTPDYFRAMGVTLLRGRLFDDHDSAASAPVAVVDEWFVARVFPDSDALGRRVDGGGLHDATIVGIVGHVETEGLGAPGLPELYLPLAQRPGPMMTMVVRASGDPAALTSLARSAIASLDAELAISNVRTMRQWVDETLAAPRLLASLGSAFGFVAILLAAIGVSGLVGYTVELRRREAGIRMALGARPNSVVTLVIANVMRALIGGASVGLAGAIVAGRLLEHQLFDRNPYDPVLLAVATITLVGTSLVASWLPARRAARVALTSVLQDE